MPSARARPIVAIAATLVALASVASATAQIGARISNTGQLSWTGPAGTRTVASNTVTLDPATSKTPTKITFHLPPIDHVMNGSRCETSPALRFTPAPIDRDTLAASPLLQTVDERQPFILVLENPGGNRDPALRETSWVSVDSGRLHLMLPLLETAVDTGVFAGGIAPPGTTPANAPCDPRLDRGAHINVSFTEDAFSFASSTRQLIDPAGFVFDSRTGALIDGAIVTLLDDNDQPAIVFGDDGISRYPSTVVSGAEVLDASGRRYDFAPGNYRFPLTAAGRYHLRVDPPANYTAPSTRSAAELAAVRDPKGRPYILNAASTGGSFTLSSPEPFYSDVPLDRDGNDGLLLTKTASVREASPGDFIQYRVTLANRGDVAVSGVRLGDTLPDGLRYERGSQRGADTPAVSDDGRRLDFAVPAIAPRTTVEIRYVVSVAPGARVGEAVNRATATGNGVTSNEAAAAVRIRPLLFTDGFTVIGRVTEGACGDPADKRHGVPGIRLLMQDGSFVVTDADGLYHFEGVRPGRHVVQIDAGTLPASHAPVACDIDTRQAGSAISRFVESDGGLLQRVDFQLRPTGAKAVADTLPVAIAGDAEAAGNRDWMAGQTPGVAMLFPLADHNPRATALRVVVKHLPTQRIALTLNGQPIDPLAFDATDTTGDVAISRWTGLRLIDGDNRLSARVLDADGRVVTTIDRVVHSSGVAADAAVVSEASRLVADGVTRPLVAVRVTDRAGRPVRAGTMLPFRVDLPYLAAVDRALAQAQGPAAAVTVARVVGDDGLAFIALEPTTQAGAVRIVATLTDDKAVHTRELRTWLTASARDWVVVGFGSGTAGYRTLDRHDRALPRGQRGRLLTDGQLALYTKGRIKGSWLATIAYDSDRPRDRDRGLLGTIDPDRYYTVYGDATRQGYDAPTERRLYLRLESRAFYALFGDFETGLTRTNLGRYNRTLNGAKLAYDGRRANVSAFAAKTDGLYARDDIPGNGLSGPYRLSRRDIVPNSDKLRLETRDRLRPERILSVTQMTRHIDYDIDPAMGTLRFRAPVLTRDADRNPVFIVAEYETYGRANRLVAGGRAAIRSTDGRVEFGTTVLHDETVANTNLIAADLTARLSRTTEVRAEAATGGRSGIDAGQAWLIEGEHHGPALDLLAYAREQDLDFGIGQQNMVEAGSRRIGFDGRLRLGARLSLAGTAWHQQQLDGPGTRTVTDLRLEMQRANGTIFVGGQLAMDRGIDGRDRDSRLLTLGGTQALLGGKLTLGGQTQVAPGGDRASLDFPVRHQVTAAYRLTPAVRLIGGYEVAQGKDFTIHTAQVGFDVAPWTGAKLASTINQQARGEDGQRLFAQYGLTQSLSLGRRWTIDATLDASSTVRGAIPAGAVVTPFQSAASGGAPSLDTAGGDYAAVTLGAAWRGDRWSWNGRVEYRASDLDDRFNLTTSLLRVLGEGRTLASQLRWSRVTQGSGAVASFAVADLSVAWRPLDSRWSVLQRFELRSERADAGFDGRNVLGVPAFGDSFQSTLRAISNLALNYRTGPEGLGHGTEATIYYGAKWVKGSYGADDYTGYVDVLGFDLRRDVGRRFDVGVQGSVQHAWSRGSVAFSGGPTIGASPAKNLWVTAGYNIAGYRDRDFAADRYTRGGPFVTMRLKLDQTVLRGRR